MFYKIAEWEPTNRMYSVFPSWISQSILEIFLILSGDEFHN